MVIDTVGSGAGLAFHAHRPVEWRRRQWSSRSGSSGARPCSPQWPPLQPGAEDAPLTAPAATGVPGLMKLLARDGLQTSSMRVGTPTASSRASQAESRGHRANKRPFRVRERGFRRLRPSLPTELFKLAERGRGVPPRRAGKGRREWREPLRQPRRSVLRRPRRSDKGAHHCHHRVPRRTHRSHPLRSFQQRRHRRSWPLPGRELAERGLVGRRGLQLRPPRPRRRAHDPGIHEQPAQRRACSGSASLICSSSRAIGSRRHGAAATAGSTCTPRRASPASRTSPSTGRCPAILLASK
jgi:hypothetical protein